MPRKTLIHIGYQKTGSTWLQTQFFNHPGLRFNMPFERSEIKDKVLFPHIFNFDEKTTRKQFEAILSTVNDDDTAVVSIESISGSFFSDGSDGIARADRIKAVFPNAAILISIREQRAMLRSSYKHYIKALGTLSLSEWLNASQLDTKGRLPIFNPIRYQYHHLITYYQSLFGDHNVLVLPYEQLRQSPECYVNRIAEFAGIELPNEVRNNLNYRHKSNRGLSAFTANLKRHFNRFFMREIVLNPKPLIAFKLDNNTLKKWAYRIDRRVSERFKLRYEKKLITEIDRWANTQFQQSNAITARLTGLDLSTYGYDLANPTSIEQ
ncbi:MAG: hypothetical protein ACI9SP_004340 [Arenicella sp.]|jgi:hypothetical protein